MADELITYQVERFRDCFDEFVVMTEDHWHEVAIHRDVVPLAPDWSGYQRLDDSGELQMVTCRANGRLVGYHISFIRPHLHYRLTLHAFTDIYFLKPEHRKGRTGMRLFQTVEKEWARRGVVKAMTACKTHLDVSSLLEYLGWEMTEKTFTKLVS